MLLSGYNFFIFIQEPPTWIMMPSDIDAKSGDSLVLNCKGSGKPVPDVIWTKAYGKLLSHLYM